MEAEIRHQPLKGILDREGAIANSREIIDKFEPYLEELCNYATKLWGRCEKSMKGVDGTPSSIVLLYYHVIQMADGVNATCSRSCFAAAIPMLRSLWEGMLSIEYILQEDFSSRSTAWMAACYARSKSFLESLDPSTERGKNIQRLKEKDEVHRHLEFLHRPPAGLSEALDRVNEMLAKEKFAKALKELTDGSGKVQKWYSINNGPRNLEQLAHRLKKPLMYEFLYRSFSEISHAQNTNRAATSDQGTHYITQMRSGRGAEEVYIMASSFLFFSTKLVGEKLRSGETVVSDLREIVRRHRPEIIRD